MAFRFVSMMFRSRFLSVLVFAPRWVSAGSYPEVESFETGVPEYFESSGGNLSISAEHLIDGKGSLRWDFKAGDSFVIRTGPLGNTNVWTGYGNYSRSSVTFPVYLGNMGDGRLLVEFRAGDKTAATLAIPFAHAGWQQLCYHYSWNSQLKWADRGLGGKLDNIRITAVEVPSPATAYFDALRYNTPRDFRDARGAITQPWSPAKHDFSGLPRPRDTDLAKVAELARRMAPAPNPKAPDDHWRKRIESHRKAITEQQMSIGHPITKGLSHYFGYLNAIADDWCACANPGLRGELAGCFHTVNDWLREQGLVVNGAQGKADNYVGRLYVDAITKMRDALAAHGTLESCVSYLKWAYNYDDQVFGENHNESMDYFHNEAYRLLRIAMAHGDPVERWHHVNRFRAALNRQLANSIKPDGAIFHHGFHYFAYGSMGMSDAAGLLALMSESRLPVEKDGLDAVRRALEMMRWYSGRTTLWSLSGRAAHGTMEPPAGAFLNLAKAYAPYHGGKWDGDLVAAFLRLAPGDQGKPEFKDHRAEASPNGFRTMPYAALAMHRRDNWLVGIKGYSKYAASGESYNNANRFGLFMSMGQMEILTHPRPLPTVIGSGTRPNEGYDWCAIEGATTIHCPPAGIANGNGTRMPRGGETFVGGLSNGSNGIFAFTYHNGITDQIMRDRPKDAPKPEPLKGLKSWFCFDNRIICLGSGISTRHVSHPVRTNLFQKFLTDDSAFVTANGRKLAMGSETIHLDITGGATLTDPFGNAYFTKDPVHVRIGSQKSRDADDGKDTVGNHATAWIEHGVDPKDAGYEYAVMVQPDEAAFAAFGNSRGYQVLKRDSQAHVVRDQATRTTAYVVFDAGAELPQGTPLIGVERPCLVMIEEHDDHVMLAVTDPDVRPESNDPAPVSIMLDGEFTAADPQAGVVSSEGNRTRITIAVLHGESHKLRLDRIPETKRRP